MKVYIDMSIAQPPASVPYETFVRVEQERDQWRSRYYDEHKARQQAERERDQERQREQQRRKLWKTKLKPAEKATIEAFQRQIESPNAHRDEAGFTRINYKTASIHIGMSEKSPKVSFDKVLAQCPDLPTLAGAQIETRREYDPELRRDIPRLYIKTEKSLVAAAISSEISQRVKQGGNQYQCQNENCLSTDVRVERRLICNKCGHSSALETTYPNGKLNNTKRAEPNRTNLSLPPQMDYSEDDGADRADDSQGEKNLNTSRQVVGMVIKPVTPPIDDSLTETPADASMSQEDAEDLTRAAELLQAIAGDDLEHIEMSLDGEKKYYTMHRPLTFFDLVDHLKGGPARGALCSYSDGTTHALLFDTDDTQTWAAYQVVARTLVQAGYIVLLDASPAGRGGHLLIVFSARVNAAAARAAVLQIAPELAECREYWPAPASAKKWNRVRLPGAWYARTGDYVEQDVEAWCQLFNAATGEIAADGLSAAKLLLSSLTPAEIVPELPPLPPISTQDETAAPEIETQEEPEAPACIVVEPEPAADLHSDCPPAEHLPTGSISAQRAAPLPNDQAAEMVSAGAGPLKLPQVDAKWIHRYGTLEQTTCYFAIIPEVAARWYNEQNPLESIRPRERNKMALSPNGNERTASTGYYDTAQGERWTDFSTHGRRQDGTHESGDALELAARVEGKSKSAFLSGVIREMISEGKAALESAAAAGRALPGWFEEPDCIITPAGRRKFAELSAAAAQGGTVTPASVTIVEPAPEIESQARDQVEQITADRAASLPNMEARQVEQEPEAPACIVVEPEHQAQASDLQTVMQEYHLTQGDPCEKCACPIERDLYGEVVCCRCFPQRGYHLYSDLIDKLYPRKRRML